MKFLGLTQNSEDFTSKEYVAQQIDIQGGKIDTLSVDGVQQEIINKNVNIDLSAKADVTALATKTTQEISNANGKAQIMNESDGGGIWFKRNDNTRTSFVGVNDSTAGGPDAQIYAIDPSNSNYGAKVDILKDGIYYTVGNQSYSERIVDTNKIATLGDIQAAAAYRIEKLEEAETGYLASYELRDALNQKCGARINIAKDLVISKAELKTCTQDDVPVEGYRVGDKYIDFTINTISGQDHIYLLVKELVDVYKADESTLTLDASTNTFSIKQAYTDAIESKINVVDSKVSQEAAARENADNIINAAKVDKPVEPVTGQGVNVPYYFDVTYNADKATVKDYTIDLLDNTKAPQQFSLDINAATASNAGLMTAADKAKLDNVENLIPTKVSELTNDSGFLTEHQSLAAYRTSSAQDTIDAGKQDAIADLETIRSGAALGATSIQSHQDISGKQDVISDLDTIRSGAALGATSIQSHQDISGKQDVISDLAEIRSGAALGATAIQTHQDISGKQDIISDLATIRSGAALGATAIQTHQSLADYSTTTQMNAAISTATTNMATIDMIPTDLSELTDDDTHRVVTDAEKALWNRIPAAPSTDGTYTLECTVASGVATYSWVLKA